MLTLVSGSNGSGKSVYAENLVRRTQGKRFYVATMVAQNEENIQRIEKHRRQRADMGFVTIEEPWNLDNVQVESDSVVLLEDLSNLVGNSIFMAGRSAERVLQAVLDLSKRCRHLIIVTISGLDAGEFDGETANYIHSLQWINDKVAEAADIVVERVNGETFHRKGNPDALV